jgi:hypothetical protein
MANTITLTNGNDSETGTILDDIIWSLDGDDTVLAELGLIQFTAAMVLMNSGGDRAMTRSMAIMITTISTVAMETTR